MAVLITGATGMIGRVLARSLGAAGLDVRVLTRRPYRAAQMFGGAIPAYEWHSIHEPVPAAAMDGVRSIVHLMGDPIIGPLTPEKRARLSLSRVVATGRLIDALGGRPVRFITASSAGIYNGCRLGVSGEEITEATLPGAPAGLLQGTFRGWEEAADPLRQNGGSLAHVRLGLVIAPGGFPGPIVELHERRCGVCFEDACKVPVITLEDAAALFAWLVLNPDVDGPVNAVAPKTLTGAAINEVLAPRPGDKRRLPLPLWVVTRFLGMEADMMFANRHVVPRRASDAGFVFSQADPVAALAAARAVQVAAVRARAKSKLPPWLRDFIRRDGGAGNAVRETKDER